MATKRPLVSDLSPVEEAESTGMEERNSKARVGNLSLEIGRGSVEGIKNPDKPIGETCASRRPMAMVLPRLIFQTKRGNI